MTVIGLLSSVTAREWAPFIAAFLQGLNEVGFVADLRPLGAAINADGATIDEIVSIPVRSLNGLELRHGLIKEVRPMWSSIA